MHLGLNIRGVVLAVVGVALTACNVSGGSSMGFLEHCNELQGDDTCRSVYTGRAFCSLCVEANQGCVIEPPALVCQADGGTAAGPDTDDGSATSSTGDPSTTVQVDTTMGVATTDEGSTSTGELPCEMEGQVDPTCMRFDAARPFCVDAVCTGCEAAGGDEFCGELDSAMPACDLVAGLCVPCGDLTRPFCEGQTPVCGGNGACLPCDAHDQCPDSACHLSANDPLVGACFAASEVVWVDNTAACPGLGTEAEPACSLQDTTMAFVDGDVWAVRIQGGTPYAERGIFDGAMTVAVIGVDSPEITGNPGQQAATLLFDEGALAYVSNVRVNGNALTHGMLCNLSEVHVQDVELRDNDGWGVFDFEPCTLVVERTLLVGNEDGGLRLNGGDLMLHNSAVALNGIGGNSTGIRLEDANADILYSTIVGNDGAGADSIECDNATGTLRNSIAMGVDAFSIELGCFPLVMDNTAMDASNFAGGTNVEVEAYTPIYFNSPAQADFTLSAPPLTPFGGVAQWQEGDPEFDADGTMRPTDGSLGYTGIDEP